MSQLSPEAQALLDAGRQALSPDAATKAKVLGAVEAKLASGATAGGAFAAGKLWLALALVAGMGGGAYVAISGSSNARTVKLEAPSEVITKTALANTERAASVTEVMAYAETPTAKPANAEPPTAKPANTEPPKLAAAEPRPTTRSTTPAKHSRSKRTVTPEVQVGQAPAESPLQALKAERTLMATAQAAIRDDDFARARTILSEHKKRYPSGVLSPERQAATAIVHCLAPVGINGKAIARRFLEAHPDSPLAGRVRLHCQLE